MKLKQRKVGIFLILGCLFWNGCKSATEDDIFTEMPDTQKAVAQMNMVTDMQISSETENYNKSLEDLPINTEGNTQINTEIQKEDIPLNEKITIKENCTQITNDMANKAFDELKQQLSDAYVGIYDCENFRMKVASEEVREDALIWVQITLSYDRIPVRKVEDDPFIMGMQEARDELTDENKIAIADEVIEGWKREKQGFLQEMKDEPRCSETDWYIIFAPESETYMIFHKGIYGNSDKMIMLKDYIQKVCQEDVEDKKAQGRVKLLEALE